MSGRSVLSEESARSRALAVALEPVVGSVYFAPEAHAAYAELGFAPSPGRVEGDGWAKSHWGRVRLPDGAAYFASRGGLLGQVRGEVIAAAFGVFNPAVVVAAIDHAWSVADADTVVAARTRGAVAQLERILGPEPDGIERVTELLARAVAPLTITGRPMFAGLSALPVPTDAIGRMWRLGDMLREYRGDAHIAAAAAAGFDGCDLQVLTERCAGMPPRSYAAGRGWDAAQLDAAERRLHHRGLLTDGQPTPAGMAAREALETETDRLCGAMVEALGDDVVELVGRLQKWSASIRAADGYYPSSPQEAILASGVQDWMREHALTPFAGAAT
jgi:peptidoglycan hydrolase-like protein with peptidoglycan-binding domain